MEYHELDNATIDQMSTEDIIATIDWLNELYINALEDGDLIEAEDMNRHWQLLGDELNIRAFNKEGIF
jgi:hypothetical protein